MQNHLPGYDAWKLASPPFAYECNLCGRTIPDEEATRWFDACEITCDECLCEMADQDHIEYRGEL